MVRLLRAWLVSFHGVRSGLSTTLKLTKKSRVASRVHWIQEGVRVMEEK